MVHCLSKTVTVTVGVKGWGGKFRKLLSIPAVFPVKFGPVPAVLPQKSFPLPLLPRVLYSSPFPLPRDSRGNPRGCTRYRAPVQISRPYEHDVITFNLLHRP